MGSSTPDGVAGSVSRDGVDASSRGRVDGFTAADKLRTLADWLDAHPSANVSQVSMIWPGEITASDYAPESAEDLAKAARTIGGKWDKIGGPESQIFKLRQEIMPGYSLELIAMRDAVCERVVTGQREVEVPDPAAPRVKVTEDVVEWRCAPVLGREEAAAAPVPEPDDLPF